MAVEKCTNCERVIGNLETPYLFSEQVVCEDCFHRLNRGPASVIDPAAAPLPEPRVISEQPTPLATAGMIMAIFGIVIPPCAIVAIIFGSMAPKDRQGKSQPRADSAVVIGILTLVFQFLIGFLIYKANSGSH